MSERQGQSVEQEVGGQDLGWDLRASAAGVKAHAKMRAFMVQEVLPAERELAIFYSSVDDPHAVPPVVERLKVSARARGLWNLFLPAESGLSQVDYCGIAELSGWSHDLAPEAINGQAPDSGNMELLHMFGTPDQKQRWLLPLLEGKIRSAFAMTEPGVASSDATNVTTSIRREGDEFVISGRKWWTTGLADPRCEVLIVMGKTQPDASRHRQQSMVLVPRHTAGLQIVRSVPVMGRQDRQGHCELVLDDVRVPVKNLLGQEGEGFAMAQARLGPGRIHHCMRALGASERALDLLSRRARHRVAFGRPLAEQGMVQQQIAESRIAIDSARALCLHAARVIDLQGSKAAAPLVSVVKVLVPRVAGQVIDRAIQVFGAAGVSDDVPLAAMYGWHRAMRILDGPDETHLRSIARFELSREAPVLDATGAPATAVAMCQFEDADASEGRTWQ